MIGEIIKELRGLVENKTLTPSNKERIEELDMLVLHKRFTPTPCSDCYRDECILMIRYLTKYGRMKEQCDYRLRRGVLLQPSFGSADFYTNDNLTNDVAEKYLRNNPNDKNLFEVLPHDVDSRLVKTQNQGYEMVEATEAKNRTKPKNEKSKSK